ncbi:MAG: hypothetical protein WDZ28_00965 [Simkaniaceae bacterium]
MKTKKLYPIILLSLFFLSTCPRKEGNTQPGDESLMPPQVQEDECSNLTPQEKAFASQLSAAHRHLFCTQFSSIQRAESMALATPTSSPKEKHAMSPDEAVEKILKSSRGQVKPSSPSKAVKPKLKIMK